MTGRLDGSAVAVILLLGQALVAGHDNCAFKEGEAFGCIINFAVCLERNKGLRVPGCSLSFIQGQDDGFTRWRDGRNGNKRGEKGVEKDLHGVATKKEQIEICVESGKLEKL